MMEIWNEIWQTVKAEFSDIPNYAQLTSVILRLSLAAMLGGILGYEREKQGKAAGVRTHMLVALGSALFVVVPQQMGVTGQDLTRVLQGLVAGIGFLGAGSIIKEKGEGQIQGLTTAANIWLTAAIGMAAGLGRESTAVISTALAWIVLTGAPRLATVYNRYRSLRDSKSRSSSDKPPNVNP